MRLSQLGQGDMKQHLGQRAQPMQRPWGRAVTGSLAEEGGGLCGWSRVSEGEREDGGQAGGGAGYSGPCGPHGGLGFSPQGVRSPGSLWGTGAGDGGGVT